MRTRHTFVTAALGSMLALGAIIAPAHAESTDASASVTNEALNFTPSNAPTGALAIRDWDPESTVVVPAQASAGIDGPPAKVTAGSTAAWFTSYGGWAKETPYADGAKVIYIPSGERFYANTETENEHGSIWYMAVYGGKAGWIYCGNTNGEC
jgi:hypothetical protein